MNRAQEGRRQRLMGEFRVVIPARYSASRLPGKPLRELAGRTLLEHVHRVACASGAAEVVIATDDARVASVAARFAQVCMTSTEHASGTDRLAEVVAQSGWPDDAIVVNLQGDEPLLPPALLRQTAQELSQQPKAGIATLCARIATATEVFDPNVVKVVRDRAGFALYFSRAPIPWHREAFAEESRMQLPPGQWWRHIGVYAYRVATLLEFAGLVADPVEGCEMLEQLRALRAGIRISVRETAAVPPAGVDTEADLVRVGRLLARVGEGGT